MLIGPKNKYFERLSKNGEFHTHLKTVVKFQKSSLLTLHLRNFVNKRKFASLTFLLIIIKVFFWVLLAPFVRIGCEKREKEKHKINLQYFTRMSREIWSTMFLWISLWNKITKNFPKLFYMRNFYSVMRYDYLQRWARWFQKLTSAKVNRWSNRNKR